MPDEEESSKKESKPEENEIDLEEEDETDGDKSDEDEFEIREHDSYGQVLLDVTRLYRLESRHYKDLRSRRELKKTLVKLIVRLLIKKPQLHYYQGFHDVCFTYYNLLDDVDLAYDKLDKVIDSHFSVYMQKTLGDTLDLLELIPIIIGLQDLRLQEFLEKAEVGVIFALSWVITWFSHDITNEQDVEKIYVFLEERDPHMILYLCAEVVLTMKDKILQLEPEMSIVHHLLCQIPRKKRLAVEKLLKGSEVAFSRWSPEFLKQKHRRNKLMMQRYDLLKNLVSRIGPNLVSMALANKGTTILVLMFASALAFQYDRWARW